MQISEPAEYSILCLLKSQPMYGYEMFQQFENGTLGQILRLEMSQMYAFLKKLEKLGYIETTLEAQGSRPPRKIHSLTASGDDVLQAWLTQPVEKPRDIRLLFLLKLYFTQKFLPQQMGKLLEQEIVACEQFLTHLETKRPSTVVAEDEAFFDSIVLRSRIYQTRALLEWLRELQAELVAPLA
jgi:DNA-binding PadR family transcriptional regulator